MLWKFILGLLPIPPYDLLLGSRAKQQAFKLYSPAEGSRYLFLLPLAAEMTRIGNLFLILAQSCARPLCACWAFVNALWTSVLSLKNLGASAFILLSVVENLFWCEILSAASEQQAETSSQSMEMLILTASLRGLFFPHLPGFQASSHFEFFNLTLWYILYQLELYSFGKPLWFWQCLDIGNV